MINTIDEALDKIYSYVDYSRTHVSNTSKEVFTLDNIHSLLKRMNNPQNCYPVIHIAGTKGKGSVCAMLAAALQNAGFKTGLYTSPHLIRFNERIQINGQMISDSEIIDLTNYIEEKTSQVNHISSFEFMTAMAFEYFKQQMVDIAIVETGLGGRLDATNVVTPILSVITSISYDHTAFLGSTIKEIAGEKAGIIKRNIPVICAAQPYPEATSVIRETAAEKNAPWINIPDRYRYINKKEFSGNDSMLIWRVEDKKLMESWCSENLQTGWEPAVINLPLRGTYQMDNCAVVFAVLNKLKARYAHLDFKKAAEGIGKTFWPCRFEDLAGDDSIILDGAHNIDSIKKLTISIARFCGNKQVKCIFGASEDKSLKEMICILAPYTDEFIMTKSTHPRAADPSVLSKIASDAGRKNRIAESLENAYDIYKTEKDNNTCFIVTGSLFVAGGIRELYMNENPSVRYFGC